MLQFFVFVLFQISCYTSLILMLVKVDKGLLQDKSTYKDNFKSYMFW